MVIVWRMRRAHGIVDVLECMWLGYRHGTGAKEKSVNNLDMKTKVFEMFQPDVVGVAETWLKGGDAGETSSY